MIRRFVKFCFGAGVLLAFSVSARGGYESAPYTLLKKDGNVEIREYPELVLASTATKLDSRGKDNSFMKLFRFISGNNQQGQKIAMTTPVFMEAGTDGAQESMGFVMPKDVVKAGTPVPKTDEVEIRKRPAGKYAVIRFSGILNEKLASAKEKELRRWMQANDVVGAETSEQAGYNSPFTPGPLRRNEVLVRVLSDPEASTE